MTDRRRLVTGLLVLTCLLLPACGSGPGGSDGPVELRVSTWGNDSRLKLTQEAVDAFTAANPDISVVVENSEWGSYWDKLATMTAANDAPDVIQMDEAYIAAYGSRGALLDLAEQPALDVGAMEATVLDTGLVEETLVGAPIGVANFSVAVNPEVLEQAGVEMPDDTSWTWDDLAEVSAQVTEELGSEGVYGLDGFGSGTAELGAWARQHGEEVWPTDGPGVSEATVSSFFEYADRLSTTEATPPASVQVENSTTPLDASLFATNRAAFHLLFHTQISAFGAASGTQLELLRLPARASGEPAQMVNKASMYWSVSARTDHPEESALLVDFLLTDPAATTVLTTERGIPAIPAVQEEIAPLLDPQATVALEFSRAVAPELVPPPQVTPSGASGFSSEFTLVGTDVLFGRASPAEGATRTLALIEASK
ncbi:ABC transporter substrate-binding protein [Auraticoccus monumenti]|uniref:Multiple sugar transport system substrate-binding protein n=1 Tax=Auraticoccus monumenti TaxID=675864 RepID=A0A1G6XRE8_9ACTN|nr:extracellular solute-binding protein [Auraticoccus monumenti]SDD80730.1 multiple sugar transport system substrate-binding protein [Auraticoccus monumenti]